MDSGPAAEWRMAVITRYNAAHTWPWTDRQGLYAAIRTDFGDANREATAIGKIRSLQQGNRTAQEYAHEFWQYAQVSGYNDVAKIQEFKRGLNKGLRERISNSDNVPTTFDAWRERAIRVDQQWRQTKAEEALYAGRSSTGANSGNREGGGNVGRPSQPMGRSWFRKPQTQPRPFPARWAPWSNPPATNQATSGRLDVPMDVDRNQRQGAPIIRCYKCGKMGHIAKNCQSEFNIRNLTYEQAQDHFKQIWEQEKTEIAERQNLKEEEGQ